MSVMTVLQIVGGHPNIGFGVAASRDSTYFPFTSQVQLVKFRLNMFSERNFFCSNHDPFGLRIVVGSPASQTTQSGELRAVIINVAIEHRRGRNSSVLKAAVAHSHFHVAHT
jgi:hypothetical protein